MPYDTRNHGNSSNGSGVWRGENHGYSLWQDSLNVRRISPDDDITEVTIPQGKVGLFNFEGAAYPSRMVSREGVLTALEHMGYDPGTKQELKEVLRRNPRLVSSKKIVEFGSSFMGTDNQSYIWIAQAGPEAPNFAPRLEGETFSCRACLFIGIIRSS